MPARVDDLAALALRERAELGVRCSRRSGSGRGARPPGGSRRQRGARAAEQEQPGPALSWNDTRPPASCTRCCASAGRGEQGGQRPRAVRQQPGRVDDRVVEGAAEEAGEGVVGEDDRARVEADGAHADRAYGAASAARTAMSRRRHAGRGGAASSRRMPAASSPATAPQAAAERRAEPGPEGEVRRAAEHIVEAGAQAVRQRGGVRDDREQGAARDAAAERLDGRRPMRGDVEGGHDRRDARHEEAGGERARSRGRRRGQKADERHRDRRRARRRASSAGERSSVGEMVAWDSRPAFVAAPARRGERDAGARAQSSELRSRWTARRDVEVFREPDETVSGDRHGHRSAVVR